MKKVRRKSFKKKDFKKTGQTFLTFFVVFNFVFYQALLPYTFVLAANPVETEEVADEEVDEEIEEQEEGEDEEGEGEEEGEEGQEGENEDEDVDDTDAEKTVEESKTEFEDVQGDEEGSTEESAEEESSTDVDVENSNEVDIENETNSLSNTGDNEITDDSEKEEGSEVDQQQEEGNEEELNLIEESGGDETGEEQKDESQDEDEKDGEEEDDEDSKEEGEVEESGVETQESSPEDTEEGLGQEGEADEEGGSEIDTGDAVAVSNIYNEANTNIYGENWLDSIINIYDFYEGDINLLDLFSELFDLAQEQENTGGNSEAGILSEEEPVDENSQEETSSEEDEGGCEEGCLGDLSIENSNDADVENIATSEANSGGNLIDQEKGDAEIQTGDAVAISNIVNIVNRNIVGENWIFAVINVFGSWQGDLVVPGLDLLSLPSATDYAYKDIVNENEATIENEAEANSQTGENKIEGNGVVAEIDTGNAISDSSVENIVNTNLIGNNWFSLSVNNLGYWLGGVNNWFGEGEELDYEFDAGETDVTGGKLSVHNSNDADVSNYAAASANSGGNEINTKKGDASIETGDAVSQSNILNFINTNIIGSNWIFAMVNVLGDWEGDVEFAYPDLEISIDDGESEAETGQELEYDVVVKNVGFADATDLRVLLSFEGEGSYASSAKKPKIQSGQYAWDFSELKKDESVSFKVKARASDSLGQGDPEVVAFAEVYTDTTEKEMGNNSDEDSTDVFEVYEPSYRYVYSDEDLDLDIEREKTINSPVSIGQVVYHAITVENDSEFPLYDVKVKDRMLDSQGGEMVSFEWPVGDLDVGDAILVEYQLLINGGASAGNYEFAASAKGDDPFDGEVRSGKSRLAMQILGGFPFGYVAGVEEEGDEPFTLIPAAQAVGPTDAVLGAYDGYGTCSVLPIWVWLAALVAYGLAINWSLFPMKDKIKIKVSKFRGVVVPVIVTAAGFIFWWTFRCDQMIWFVIVMLAILLMHLMYKERKIKKQIAFSDNLQTKKT